MKFFTTTHQLADRALGQLLHVQACRDRQCGLRCDRLDDAFDVLGGGDAELLIAARDIDRDTEVVFAALLA
ncbi:MULTISPECIES: hypothetical protein [Streptomyces]|uniref:hypothetical protein n=1 Tax=Streptomyces TaxID=1883 RepID=UPI002F93935B